jgi:putative protease
MPLVAAEKQPLTGARLRDQLGRLGGTPFSLGRLESFVTGEVMLPVSELNRMRRDLVAQLEHLRAQPKRWQLNEAGFTTEARRHREISAPNRSSQRDDPTSTSERSSQRDDPTKAGIAASEAELVVMVRNMSQLESVLGAGIRTVYCEFEDPKKYLDAVTLVRSARTTSGKPVPEIFVAPARIFKMGEEWTLKQVRSAEADGYLVRNYDHLTYFANERRIGDYSLNVANSLTAEYFKTRFGLERVTTSYDLNFTQLESLLRGAPPEWFEITIHQHMPMFHMEHCVFCAFLSQGTDYTNCGRPCDKHEVKLRDRVGAEHPVKADVGCRNTVFNALAQTGADYVAQMLALGARRFRVEFLDETPAMVEKTLTRYRQLLRGEITGAQVWRELKLFNQLGVTRGQIGR